VHYVRGRFRKKGASYAFSVPLAGWTSTVIAHEPLGDAFISFNSWHHIIVDRTSLILTAQVSKIKYAGIRFAA
jgi:hypothetical protein